MSGCADGMKDAASRNMFSLQQCSACHRFQYPPREVCGTCLSDRIQWREQAQWPGRVRALTVLRHSHLPEWAPCLPVSIGLVEVGEGVMVVSFLDPDLAPGSRVMVTACLDNHERPVLRASVSASDPGGDVGAS